MSDFERGFGTLVGIIIGVVIIYLVLALGEYILRGVALYRMASNARFSTPVLAWIPIASSYLLGVSVTARSTAAAASSGGCR